MNDIKKLPYAEWLEESLQNIVDKPVQSICIITKFNTGDTGTGYYECSVADKLLFAGFLQQDAMFDALKANGYIEDDEDEDEYLEPLYDALEKIGEIPSRVISSDITEKNGTAWVTARSATFMRGINLDNKVLIVDECQNMTIPIIKRILSRAHDNCKVIVCGCLAQTDIPISKSGFKDLIEHMRDYDGCVKCELPISYRGRLAMWIDKL